MRVLRTENLRNASTEIFCVKEFWGKKYKKCQYWAVTFFAYRKEMRVYRFRKRRCVVFTESLHEFLIVPEMIWLFSDKCRIDDTLKSRVVMSNYCSRSSQLVRFYLKSFFTSHLFLVIATIQTLLEKPKCFLKLTTMLQGVPQWNGQSNLPLTDRHM